MDAASKPNVAKKAVKRKKAAQVTASEPKANKLESKLEILELKSVPAANIEGETRKRIKKLKKPKVKTTVLEPSNIEPVTQQSSVIQENVEKHVEKKEKPPAPMKAEDRYPILKDKELIDRFMKVEMNNNQKGRIRQNVRESLMGTSKALIPEIINNKIQSIIKTSISLTDAELRRIRILFNLLKTTLKGEDINAADKGKKGKDTGEEKKGKDKKEKVKKPKRYVVFLGNLPLEVKKEKIMDHFKEMSEHIVDIRIPKKQESTKSSIAYLELSNEPSFEFALSKHHSMMGSRRINVLYSSPKDSKMSKATAKSKTAKMAALQKSGKLVGSLPLAKKRSQRRLKAKRAQAKLAATA